MSFAFWPTRKMQSSEAAAFDISGQWDLEIKFAASTASQIFFFEQMNTDQTGTHTASLAPRDLSGTLHGQEIIIRSSYTGRGMRLNFTFSGTVDNDTMKGRVSLSEYGMAEW